MAPFFLKFRQNFVLLIYSPFSERAHEAYMCESRSYYFPRVFRNPK